MSPSSTKHSNFKQDQDFFYLLRRKERETPIVSLSQSSDAQQVSFQNPCFPVHTFAKQLLFSFSLSSRDFTRKSLYFRTILPLKTGSPFESQLPSCIVFSSEVLVSNITHIFSCDLSPGSRLGED